MKVSVSQPDASDLSLLAEAIEPILEAANARDILAEELEQQGSRLLEVLKHLLDHYLSVDPNKASAIAEHAYALSHSLPEASTRALGQWCRALGLISLGEFQRAIPHFETAFHDYHRANDPVSAFRVATRQVQALAMIGDLQAAQQRADEARRGFKAQNLRLEAAQVENNLGIIQTRLGQYHEAVMTLQEAKRGFEEHANQLGIARTHVNLGWAYEGLDKFQEAQHHFQGAIGIFKTLDNRQLMAGTLINLAQLHRREGKLVLVLDTLAEAKALLCQTTSQAELALAELEEARTYYDLNLLDEAQSLAERLKSMFAEKDMQLEVLEASTLLGMSLVKAGSYTRAQAVLEEAQRGWQTLGNAAQSAWVDSYLAMLMLALLEAGVETVSVQDVEAAIEAARQGFETSQSQAGMAVVYVAQGQLALFRGEITEAQHALQHSERLALELGLTDLLIRSLHLLGIVAARRRQTKHAEAYFQRAIKELETVRASLQVDEFKAAYFGEKLDVYGDLMALLVKQGRYAEALYTIERSKSRALLDLLTQGSSNSAGDSQLAGLQGELQEVRSQLNTAYLSIESSRAELSQSNTTSWQSIREAEQRVSSILREMERQSAQNPSQLLVPDVHSVQQALSPGTSIITYAALGEELLAFVLSKDDLRCVQSLGKLSEVTEHLERLSFFMLRVAQGQAYEEVYGAGVLLERTCRTLQALHQQLIAPLELKASDQLVFIPFGAMHNLPFAALFDGETYLGDKAQLSLAPSTAVYLHCRARPDNSSGSVVAYGVPFEDIPSVRDEIEIVSRSSPSALGLIGAEATLGAFYRHAPEASVLHIATHGIYRPDNPMFSGLRFHDGWLAARDLYGLQLQSSLVVLSACETGLASHQDGDERFGLARAFLHAGTPCMLVSLWSVKDDATAQLMAAFYQALNGGQTVAEALQSAQQVLRHSYPNPYFWSAFTVIGDPERRLAGFS